MPYVRPDSRTGPPRRFVPLLSREISGAFSHGRRIKNMPVWREFVRTDCLRTATIMDKR